MSVTPASDDLAERLMDLEVKVAYQDRTIAELDHVVRELAARIAALEAKVAAAPPPVEPIL